MPRFLRHPVATLFDYYRSYHEPESWRLKYIGWLATFGFVTFYFIRFLRPNPNPTDDLVLRSIAIVLMIGLGLRDWWPKRALRFYLPYAYFVTLFCLPYLFTYTALIRGGGVPSISNSFLVVAFLLLLTDWRNTIAMLVVGIALGWLTYSLVTPSPQVPRDMLPQVPALLLIIAGAIITESRLRTEQARNEARIGALRDSVGFLAHELNTPLATVRGYVDAVRSMHVGETQAREVRFEERKPGELLKALATIEHGAQYCQSLVSMVAKSARHLATEEEVVQVPASKLVREVLDTYPFEGDQRSWIRLGVKQDFDLPGRRDLLYLVLCTIVQNALHALRESPSPQLRIEIGPLSIAFHDNGTGIPADVLKVLTKRSISTRKDGTGMGLLFARRVMLTLGGAVRIESDGSHGAAVTLLFDVSSEDSLEPGSSRF
jgi:signal transduction histidine kinase